MSDSGRHYPEDRQFDSQRNPNAIDELIADIEHREAEGRDEEADLAMCEAASESPWVVEYRRFADPIMVHDCYNVGPLIVLTDNNQTKVDVDFAAMARTALPHYILALRTCRQERDEAREALGKETAR